MARLEGVKTLDMVNGEITKVEYNGEVYEKVATPKKGDIGLFTEDSWVSLTEGGLVFTEIIDVDDVGDPQVSSELGSVWRSKYLTYFRKPSAPSLKAGDKVRLISDNPKYGFGLVRVGDVGEVRRINGGVIVVDFPNHTHWNGVISDIEPVGVEEVSEEQAESQKVKVGDTIRMLRDCFCGGYSAGDTFGVISVDDSGATFVDNDGDYRSVGFMFDTRYEVVTDLEPEEEAQPKRTIAISGDVVEMITDDKAYCYKKSDKFTTEYDKYGV